MERFDVPPSEEAGTPTAHSVDKPMPPIQQTIQGLVAPVVLISANGLICLALYNNRLAAVTSRARAFHKEWFDLFARLSGMEPAEQAAGDGRHLADRIKILDEMGHRLIVRARLLRDSLFCLLLSVLLLLACSLGLGVPLVMPYVEWPAIVLFYLGVLVMMAGIVLAMLELRSALDPLLMEHQMIEKIHQR
jgi:hypothetical protein